MKSKELDEHIKKLSKIPEYAKRNKAMHEFCRENNINTMIVFPTVAYLRREGIWAFSR